LTEKLFIIPHVKEDKGSLQEPKISLSFDFVQGQKALSNPITWINSLDDYQRFIKNVLLIKVSAILFDKNKHCDRHYFPEPADF